MKKSIYIKSVFLLSFILHSWFFTESFAQEVRTIPRQINYTYYCDPGIEYECYDTEILDGGSLLVREGAKINMTSTYSRIDVKPGGFLNLKGKLTREWYPNGDDRHWQGIFVHGKDLTNPKPGTAYLEGAHIEYALYGIANFHQEKNYPKDSVGFYDNRTCLNGEIRINNSTFQYCRTSIALDFRGIGSNERETTKITKTEFLQCGIYGGESNRYAPVKNKILYEVDIIGDPDKFVNFYISDCEFNGTFSNGLLCINQGVIVISSRFNHNWRSINFYDSNRYLIPPNTSIMHLDFIANDCAVTSRYKGITLNNCVSPKVFNNYMNIAPTYLDNKSYDIAAKKKRVCLEWNGGFFHRARIENNRIGYTDNSTLSAYGIFLTLVRTSFINPSIDELVAKMKKENHFHPWVEEFEKVNWFGFAIIENSFNSKSQNVNSSSKENEIIKIWPIPANDKISIESDQRKISQIRIFNTLGQMIYSSANLSTTNHEISCRDWNRGIYTVIVNSNTGELSKQKIIISN